MMKNSLRGIGALILTALLAGFLTSCGSSGGGGGSGGVGGASLGRMDLSGAKALVIAPRGTTSGIQTAAIDDEPDVLYKLTEDGLLIEVTFYDDQGNVTSSESYLPEYIEDINDEYVFVLFSNNNWHGPWPPQFIVKKSSGFVSHMEHEALTFFDVFNRKHYFHSKAYGDTQDGNAYYRSGEGEYTPLRKIEFGASGVLTDTRVSPVGDSTHHNESLDPLTAIAQDGTVFYSNFDTNRLISKEGRVIDLIPEIIANQPEMRPFLLGEIYGYSGIQRPFVGTDGAIYFQNASLANYMWREMYFVPQGPGGDFPNVPPDPNGPPILVYDATGSNPIQPYNPDTGAPVDLRNPVSVCSVKTDCSEFPFTIPEDWNWFPRPLEWTYPHEELADSEGNIGWRYDEFGNRYRWHWYPAELSASVWRLTEDQDGDFRLAPYGGFVTNQPWLPEKAPDGTMYYSEENVSFISSTSGASAFLRFSDKIIQIVVSDLGTELISAYEINNPAQRPFKVESVSDVLLEVESAETTDNYYYLLGRSVDDAQVSLYRFDAATHTPTELIAGSEYELYKFTVTKDNEVVFRGIRRSDGADIGGTIDLAGEITIIEAIQNRDIVQLERVL